MDPASIRTLLSIVNSEPAARRPQPAPTPAPIPPPAQRAILGRMVLLKAAAEAAAAKQAQQAPPGRAIQPAPTAPPVVTALPHVGTGPVAPPVNPQEPQTQTPATAGGEVVQQPPPPTPPSSPGDYLGLGTSNALGFLGEKAAGGLGLINQSAPVQAVGDTGVAHAVGSAVSTALTAPQAAVITGEGQNMYDFVMGKHDAVAVAVDMNLPFRRKLFEWAAAHPEQVKDAYENGYFSRDGQERWTGGRAVWEAYARENLTGNLAGAVVGTITDPWNALPIIGKAGEGLRGAGVAIKAAAAEDAATAVLKSAGATAGSTLGDDMARQALLELGSGDPRRVDAVLRNVSPQMADDFASGKLKLAAFPQALEPLARAWATKEATKLATTQPGLLKLGRAIELTGHAIEAPAKMLDELPSKVVGKVASKSIDPVLSAAARSRIGATIGRFFETSPRARALRQVNQVIAARAQRTRALEREREIRSMFTPQQANMLFGPPGPTQGYLNPPSPTFAQTLNPTQINLSGQPVAGAAAAAAPIVVPPAPTTGTLPLGIDPATLRLRNQMVTDLAPPGTRTIVAPAAEAPPALVTPAAEPSASTATALPSPNVEAAAAPHEPATAAAPSPAAEATAPYVEQFSSAKTASRAQAEERARQRMSTLAAVDPEAAPEINRLTDELMAERADINKTGGPEYRTRNAVNRVDLWYAEFSAERDARGILADRGRTLPPHVNDQAGEMAKALDALAWNPDPAAAEAARQQLERIVANSDDPQGFGSALRHAMGDAEGNRELLPAHEPRVPGEIVNPLQATEPATVMRPAEPTPRAAARASMTGPWEMAGYEPHDVATIATDPARFQPRGGVSAEVVDQLAREWDWKRYEPITVWRDPANNQDYVLAGHHRLKAAQARGDISEIDVKRFNGTEQEAIDYARTSNNQRPESPLERSNTVRRLYDAANGDVPLSPDDERRVLVGLNIPGVKPSERQKLLNLSRLPVAIRDDIAVHPNMGKANLDAHATLGSRIDPQARPHGEIQTVTPAEAESLYRAIQKQKPRLPDGSPPPMSAKDVAQVVDGIDAMTGMSRTDQMGLFAGMATDDGRAAGFISTVADMANHNRELKRRTARVSAALKQIDGDYAALQRELDALPEGVDNPDLMDRIAKKQAARDALQGEVDEARLALEASQTQATRLIDNVNRENDTRDNRINSYIIPPPRALIDAAKAGGEVFGMVGDWRDEVATQRAATVAENTARTAGIQTEIAGAPHLGTGPIIAPEANDVLAQTFNATNTTYQGRSFGEVADEIDTRVTAEKNRLIQLLGQPSSLMTSKESAELRKLQKAYPTVRTLADATKINTDAIFRRELHRAMLEHEGVRDVTGFGKLLDRASTLYSALNLLAPWSVGRYYVGNLLGDSWQILLADGPVAMRAANDPRLIASMTNYAIRGGDPLVGSLGDLVKASGLGGFHPQLMDETMASAVLPSQRTAIRRAGGRSSFNAIGDIAASGKNPINVARNLVNGLEWAHRTGLWGHHFRNEVVLAKSAFADSMRETALRHSVAPEEVHQVMDLILNPVVDGTKVADTFSRLAYARGVKYDDAANFGLEMGRKWQSVIYRADETARGRVNKTLFSYEQKNVDTFLRRFVPFHWWMSRAIPFYAEQMIRHPGFTAAYYRLYNSTREESEANGWPDTLKKFLYAWEGPGGMMMMGAPLSALGLMDNFIEADGGYTNDNVSAIGNALNTGSSFGVSLLPWWGAMLNHLGYLGDSPFGLDPIGLSQTRRFVGGMAQFAAGQGWLGENAQTILSKPYEQALIDIRSHLSGIAPGSYHIDQTDPNMMPAVQVRGIMLRDHLKTLGMDTNAYLALGAAAQADPTSPEAQKLDEINDRVASDELDAGPLYRQAVREWSESNAILLGANAIIPGPKATRQEDALTLQSLANALGAPTAFRPDAATAVGGLGVLPARNSTGQLVDPTSTMAVDRGDAEFVRRWQQQFGTTFAPGDIERMRDAAKLANQEQNATPQAAKLMGQQAAYYAIGSEKGRNRLDVYNAIAYDSNGHAVDIRSQNVYLSAGQVRSLDPATRRTLADAWLVDRDDDQSAARAREVRGIYEDTHPELGAYRAWSRDTRTQWGTPAAFRTAAVKTNANYAAWVDREMNRMRADNLTPSEMTDKLDGETFGMNAYMAYMGIQSSRYDPTPLATGAPPPVASEGAPLGGITGGGGYGYADWGSRVRKAITETDAALRVAQQYTGANMLQVPEEIRKGVMAQPGFPAAGQLPSDAWIYEDYINFYHDQKAAGGNTSIDAFINSTRKPDPTKTSNYQPGAWPPVIAASP